MPLVELWRERREEFENKLISQLVGIAGNGQLGDNNQTSEELRNFFDQIPSKTVEAYITQCLASSFPQSGLVLQDLINQVGRRLGFSVFYGRYKGVKGQPGHDGMWTFPNRQHSLVIEVKTTDTYRIDLDRIASYRHKLISSNELNEQSSILLVVGRDETGGLESQVRGSKHAWDVRLISIDALIRLMKLKEEVEDPDTVYRIHNMLVPREFTKLDEIIELLFLTASEVKQDTSPEVEETEQLKGIAPASFHDECIRRAEVKLDVALIRHSKARYSSPNEEIAVTCHVSKFYDRPGYHYWFAFHPHQSEFLSNASHGYVLFGCGSAQHVLLIPFSEFRSWLDSKTMNTTERGDGYYFHIQIANENDKFWLIRRKAIDPIELTQYLI